MEILRIGDLSNSIVERGEIVFELGAVEDEITKEIKGTGEVASERFSLI